MELSRSDLSLLDTTGTAQGFTQHIMKYQNTHKLTNHDANVQENIVCINFICLSLCVGVIYVLCMVFTLTLHMTHSI